MKFGLFGINTGACALPKCAAAVARAAEEAGFESVWTGEHVILPDPQAPPSPVAADYPMLDPAVALAFLAAHTTTIRLGTGIIILPQRNPVVLAKELASADVLSNGRLIFGIGVGYLKPEFEAIGAPFDHKGARAEEWLAAMIALWSMASRSSAASGSSSRASMRRPGRCSSRIRKSSLGAIRARPTAGRRGWPKDGTDFRWTWTRRRSASRGSGQLQQRAGGSRSWS